MTHRRRRRYDHALFAGTLLPFAASEQHPVYRTPVWQVVLLDRGRRFSGTTVLPFRLRLPRGAGCTGGGPSSGPPGRRQGKTKIDFQMILPADSVHPNQYMQSVDVAQVGQRFATRRRRSFQGRPFSSDTRMVRSVFFLMLCLCALRPTFAVGVPKVDITCPVNNFACPSGRCIPRHWTCDGEDDCGDSADEKGCESRTCQANEFKCLHNNKCISLHWQCDGSDDCGDNSDEDPNVCGKRECTSDQFKCLSDGKCIPLQWVCDGHQDCLDDSDERNRQCSTRSCDTVNEFRCGNGRCIPKAWECDRDNDCGDNSDEHDKCSYHCNSTDFQCKSDKRCIPFAWVCDGQLDCPDRSDESDCVDVSPTMSRACKQHEFQCRDGACVNKKFVCDGDVDCPDFSDEDNCAHKCSFLHFQCQKDGNCIPAVYRCNGVRDCLDGSDEANCEPDGKPEAKHCDPQKQFDCQNGFCIPWKEVCDKVPNCPGAKPLDEEPYANCSNKDVNFCGTTRCQQICTNTPLGARCSCAVGYAVSEFDPKNCVDVNECLTPGTCSQICINTEGSYQCRCHHGYALLYDKRSCRAVGPFPKLLLANRVSIRQIDLISMSAYPLVNNMSSVIAIDYSYRRRILFWSDVVTEKIYGCPMDANYTIANVTECLKPIVSNNVTTPDGLAVDWVHDLIYWTDTGADTISVAKFDGSFRRTLIRKDLDEPRAITLDPACGVMFWTDWGAEPKIETAGMDGTNRFVIERDAIWPNGLTVDLLEHRLYWVDAKLKQICSSDYYGQNKRVILNSRNRIYHPFSIAVFEEQLYWTDWSTDGVHVANKFTGENNHVVMNGIFGVMTVKVFHPAVQPEWPNKCVDSACEQLCIPTLKLVKGKFDWYKYYPGAKPYVCLCADGYVLHENARNCTSIHLLPNSSWPSVTTSTAKVVTPSSSLAQEAVSEGGSSAGLVVSLLLLLLLALTLVAWVYWKRHSFNIHFNQFFSLSYPFCRRSQDHYDHLRLTLENDEYQSSSALSGSGSGIYQPTVKDGRAELLSSDTGYMLGKDGDFLGGSDSHYPAGAIA
uniref:EGF-like domain-containing protein n=1 Tax=Trichuris muris TaxID=70415 RepID=A0A5S6Q5T2_TRIMR